MSTYDSREREPDYPWSSTGSGLRMTWRMTREGLCMHWTLESPDAQPVAQTDGILQTLFEAA
jgi:hypothetical protein